MEPIATMSPRELLARIDRMLRQPVPPLRRPDLDPQTARPLYERLIARFFACFR